MIAYRELDDALGLTDIAGAALSECRRGRNTRHLLTGLFRQPVFGRLAGYLGNVGLSPVSRVMKPQGRGLRLFNTLIVCVEIAVQSRDSVRQQSLVRRIQN